MSFDNFTNDFCLASSVVTQSQEEINQMRSLPVCLRVKQDISCQIRLTVGKGSKTHAW